MTMSSEGRHQHLERDQIELHDQHGRLWLGTSMNGIDIYHRPKLTLVGTPMPMVSTPHDFYPPAKYLLWSVRQPSQLTIDYQAWVDDVKLAHQDIQRELSRLAILFYRSEAPHYAKNPSK